MPDRRHLGDGGGRGRDRRRCAAPWQLYAANAVLAFGWAGTSLGVITNTLGLWFDKKRGMAISLALNGASFGGIVGVPLLVAAIGNFGFSGAMMAAAIAMIALMVPVILIFVGRPPGARGGKRGGGRRDAPSPTQIRAQAFRDVGFPLGLDCLCAGAVRAGRIHRPLDLVSRSGHRAASTPRSRWRC